ncbi:proline dehydrogenase family protein [Streptosporangiaceae bacterium NEAU-GS5]|nr:proline dehydrogenase family protein [Streptosporangiaceae bacterium NEAU-GS5]
MLRQILLAASRSPQAERVVKHARLSGLVGRFVAGESADDAVRVVRRLAGQGLRVTIDHLGEGVVEPGQAARGTDAYLTLLDRLGGLAKGADLSVKLSAIGLHLDHGLARDNAAKICSAAADVGATVTLDMEDHPAVEPTLVIHGSLREEFPDVGAVVQAYLRGAEDYCRALSAGRVRLCKGAYDAPGDAAFTTARDVDRSFARCLRLLMSGHGYPMIATHDPRLIEIASALAVLNEREPGSFEFQMLYGVRSAEQRRLVALGQLVRVYVPYGDDWYGYLVRRLAERPANLAVLGRSLITRQ